MATAPIRTPPPLSIRPIAASDTAALRHAVMHSYIPLDRQLVFYDHEPSTVHLGAFAPAAIQSSTGAMTNADETLVGCLTLTTETYIKPESAPPSFPRPLPARQIQLHKFAVANKLQGTGIGRQLFLAAVKYETEEGKGQPTLLHFDARAPLRGWYERLGATVLDEEIFIKHHPGGDGPGVEHIRMGLIC